MNQRLTRPILFSALCVWSAGAGHAAAEGRSFFEPFDRLDRDRWFVSSGWANGDHQSCLWHRNRVRVTDGRLLLALTANAKGDRDLSCAELQSEARFGYGTFEARMKVPYAEGMNANLFTFIGAPQDRPHNEIDFEFIARDGPVLQTNFHIPGDSENTELHAVTQDDAFRTYSFIWQPGRIRWFIDGTLIREVSEGPLPDEAQKLYLSLWSTDTLIAWMGTFDPASAPQVLEVDWVAYTADGEGCAFDGSVLCRDRVRP
ncbi:MAG: family 16 glycosylhydrolase [Pseudomonadota bacterium]